MRILAAASVGSHLETICAIEKALRFRFPKLQLMIADMVGFSPWDCRKISYPGEAKRIEFSPRVCGVGDSRLDMLSWQAIKKGAVRLLESFHPDLLLLVDDSWYGEYALLRSAQRRQYPSLLIQEGPFRQGILPLNDRNISIVHKAKKYIRTGLQLLTRKIPAPQMPYYGSGGATCLAVASQHYAYLFRQAGVPSDRIHVTGIPRYDKLAELREKISGHHKSCHVSGKRQILLIHQPFIRYGELTIEQYSRVCEIVASGLNQILAKGDATLTIRLHPSDIEADLAPLLNRLCGAFKIQKSEMPLLYIILKYDLLIGFYSSALLEGMALDIPVITIDTGLQDPRMQWFRDAGVLDASSSGELAAFCEIILNKIELHQVRKDALLDEMGVVDGCAAERIATLLQMNYCSGLTNRSEKEKK